MLKCPRCGNVEFGCGKMEHDFPCPVAGCNGVIRVQKRAGDVPLWKKPKGGSLAWVNQEETEHPEDEPESPFLFQAMEEGCLQVCGVKGAVPAELTVPATWKGRKVVRIAPYALKNEQRITRLTLPDTLQSIGYESFAGCRALEVVQFGNGMMLLDAFAFRDCTRLCRLLLSEPPLLVMDSAFAGCDALDERERAKMQVVEA